jgi:thiol-disulfide isomerase/thioredoxin
MLKKTGFISFIILLIVAIACDKIEEPYTTQHNTPSQDTIKILKKVLVEDYTGHLCVNCPDAHEVLHQLMEAYPEQIIPIAFHVGNFAAPISGSDYNNDFRTPEGGQLDTAFGCSDAGLPVGMVNRKKIDGSYLLSKDQWGTAISELLQTPQSINLKIKNSYESGSRKLTTGITVNYLSNLSNDSLYIVAYLTEDSIIAAQKSSNGDIKKYVHMHMMRGSLDNSTWGKALSGSFTAGDSSEVNYTMTLKTNFKPEHCHVVVFVYNNNTSADNYLEIYQADIADVEN